jgi:hypothetical protein
MGRSRYGWDARPGEITFSLSAARAEFRYMPAKLMHAGAGAGLTALA